MKDMNYGSHGSHGSEKKGGGGGGKKGASYSSGGKKCGSASGQSMDVWGGDKQSLRGSSGKKGK